MIEILKQISGVNQALRQNAYSIAKTGYSEWAPEDEMALQDLINTLASEEEYNDLYWFYHDILMTQIAVLPMGESCIHTYIKEE